MLLFQAKNDIDLKTLPSFYNSHYVLLKISVPGYVAECYNRPCAMYQEKLPCCPQEEFLDKLGWLVGNVIFFKASKTTNRWQSFVVYVTFFCEDQIQRCSWRSALDQSLDLHQIFIRPKCTLPAVQTPYKWRETPQVFTSSAMKRYSIRICTNLPSSCIW